MPAFLIEQSKYPFLVEEEEMQKVHSPFPRSENSTNWPGIHEKSDIRFSSLNFRRYVRISGVSWMTLSTVQSDGTNSCSISKIFLLFNNLRVGNPVHYVKNTDVHRAGDRAFAASYTQIHTKPFLVINELVE